MANKSYAEKVKNAQVMLSGLKAHASELARRGINPAFLTNLETKIGSSILLNNEQEKLKADLKAKTAALDNEVKKMQMLASEAQKIVKLDVPQEQWKEFGIQSRR